MSLTGRFSGGPVDDLLIDVMPIRGEVTGTASKWFPEALASAKRVDLSNGTFVHVIDAPCFLATKLEAFADRGNRDFYASRDIEDVVTIIDGCSQIISEIRAADYSVREFIARSIAALLKDRDFRCATWTL